jgi:hypothetical protein
MEDIKMTNCVYCGERKARTIDHVISKCLFPSSYNKKDVITVPCCSECNKSFSLDEEYFRNFICSISSESSENASILFNTKIIKSIQRRPQIGWKFFSRMKLVDVYTKNGIYIDQKTQISIPEEDRKRYFNVLDKYIKGLFFYEFKKILPKNFKIDHFFGTKELLNNFKLIKKWNLSNEEIFIYGYNFVPGNYESIWITIFYRSVFFVSFVFKEERFKNLKIGDC